MFTCGTTLCRRWFQHLINIRYWLTRGRNSDIQITYRTRTHELVRTGFLQRLPASGFMSMCYWHWNALYRGGETWRLNPNAQYSRSCLWEEENSARKKIALLFVTFAHKRRPTYRWLATKQVNKRRHFLKRWGGHINELKQHPKITK